MATNTRRSTGDYIPRDHYAEVTAQVIDAIEAGTPPWQRPWDRKEASGPAMPCNATTGARYRGINVVTLGMSPLAFCSGDPRWATYKQSADRGWQVKKGERGTTAYFFKRLEVRDKNAGEGEDATKRIPLLRSFSLFHASQIENIPDFQMPTLEEAPWRAPEAAELVVSNSRAVVRIGGDRAFYSPGTDHIQMPPQHAFHSAAGWSSTILHELGHWTGTESRLKRDMTGRFRSHDYAREELRAELAQVMVCAELGIADVDFNNDAAYLAEWLKALHSDRKEIFRAAADAQRIADYLLAFHPAYAARDGGTEPADAGEAAPEADDNRSALALAAAA